MPILNKTKNKLLAKEYRFCSSEFSKLKGLMFTKKFPQALIFDMKKEQLINVHMFFVFYPIDVLWLDKNKKIIYLKKSFKPFRFSILNKPAQYIIELKNKTIEKTNTKIGDIVNFK